MVFLYFPQMFNMQYLIILIQYTVYWTIMIALNLLMYWVLFKINSNLNMFFKEQEDRTYPYRFNKYFLISVTILNITYYGSTIIIGVLKYCTPVDEDVQTVKKFRDYIYLPSL